MSITGQTLEQRMSARMLAEMQKELDKIAEPIITKALAEIQEQLRRRMGAMAIGLLSTSYDVQHDRDRLVITVHVKEPKAP